MGNSASEGFDPAQVISTLDNNLGSVHIKDRKIGGSSVPLGQGDVKFLRVFQHIKLINYRGSLERAFESPYNHVCKLDTVKLIKHLIPR